MTYNNKTFNYVTNVSKRHVADKYKLMILLVFIFVLIAVDVSMDVIDGLPRDKLLFEVSLECLILCVVGYTVFYIWKRFSRESTARIVVEEDLKKTREQSKVWEEQSRSFASEFNSYVENRFNQWGLSHSEKEVSLLLIMGKSTKEIAKTRFTSDRTIRNQCQAIYEKSQCKGRNELTAYFLSPLFKQKSIQVQTTHIKTPAELQLH